MSIALYYHTLRYLKPSQIYGRVLFRYANPRPELAPAPPRRAALDAWVLPARRRPSLLGPSRCRFLNDDHDISDAGAWNDAAREKLWLYNLHYFDDLNAEHAEARRAWHRPLVERWIAENPPGTGTGWEPYPTSLRIVNWIKWALGGAELPESAQHSLAVQLRWLGRRLEWHLLGNHLLVNAKALVFGGLFFEGDEARAWFERGLEILKKEVAEQVLADGGHFERSPMYHSLVLEDLLDLTNLFKVFGRSAPTAWLAAIASMRVWLAAMSHPDREISLFNDAAFGIAPPPRELDRYARDLGLDEIADACGQVVHLEASGYVRVETARGLALLDVGKIGPDYLPGHAHADTLSFELSLFGRRFFVDTGTSRYGIGEERQLQRSTRAHNTVEVDGEDSSEVWGGFRVARRAQPLDVRVEQRLAGIYVSGAHDGYRRLPGRVVHRREWQFTDNSLTVSDTLQGYYKQALVRYHLHPDVEVADDAAGKGELILEGEKVRWRVTGGDTDVVPSTWHPEFGVAVPNHCIRVRLTSPLCKMELNW